MCLANETPPGGPNTAAVALLLQGGKFLLIKRAEREGDPWSGHVGFPGGHWKPGESLLDTVTREVLEEVGIDLRTAHLMGVMEPDSPMNARDLKVYPFVFKLDSVGDIRLGEEVAGYMWVTKSDLVETEWRGRPAFNVMGWIVWGLTYRFIKRAIQCGII